MRKSFALAAVMAAILTIGCGLRDSGERVGGIFLCGVKNAAVHLAISNASADETSIPQRPAPLAVTDAMTVAAAAPTRAVEGAVAIAALGEPIHPLPISRDLSSVRPECTTQQRTILVRMPPQPSPAARIILARVHGRPTEKGVCEVAKG